MQFKQEKTKENKSFRFSFQIVNFFQLIFENLHSVNRTLLQPYTKL